MAAEINCKIVVTLMLLMGFFWKTRGKCLDEGIYVCDLLLHDLISIRLFRIYF